MSSELNDTSPIPFSEERRDYGSPRSQGREEATLGRPGGQP